MEKRRLGKSNLLVNPVGLGCMGFSHAYGVSTEQNEAIRTIRNAYDIGYDFYDTAECYTGTNADGSTSYNEELVGKALKDIRSKVIVASKFGVTHGGDHLILNSRPEVIRHSIEGSLKRLGMDYIDIYYQHRIDPNVDAEEVAGIMSELIKEGKIRHWGISEVNEEYLRKADAVCSVAVIENRYSMIARQYETLFPVVEELDVAYVAFSPMANGFLTGQYSASSEFSEGDFRNHMPQYTKEGFQKGKELLELLRQMAEDKHATQAQLSLAWMICKKPYIIPIPGSRKVSRIKENFEAGNIMITPDEIRSLDEKLEGMNIPVFGGHSGS